MNLNYLEFEQPIAELKEKINELRQLDIDGEINLKEETEKLEKKAEELTKAIFANLTTMQIVQLARHPLRPYTEDYIEHIFTDFDELHGDRFFARGSSIVAGLARFNDQPVMIMGHQKGRKTAEKLTRNFGMPRPEDYRKTQRLFAMAEKFKLPLITFIDTAGAYPGIGAEERNQSEAIARNLYMLSDLKVPVITIVTGEGGSGGALALGVSDRIAMLQYSVYSVISPEGCASILWKSTDKAAEAAEALGMTAKKIYELGLIDEIIEEPLGGAHTNVELTAARVKVFIAKRLAELQSLSQEDLLAQRYKRLMNYGRD
ncbi:MAG: acetyl-CoA carboxylase carboxyltransferase subunit alpha [Gammaproteobacteria bacterium RIFCSPHIGHO2_12_FULL_35_23]|nr:MAG: acetyl-CoA carboxylase carboxyltransferase subunit alpha [Gammaproteobacteria bacterium RIFCSPHIGHO2_12_FULL_35_23]